MQEEIVRATVDGIQAEDKGKHLISYHPWGGTCSSEWFHNENWLDFNMAQTGHSYKNNPVYNMMLQNYKLKPNKPIINGEPQYEDHPVHFTPNNERFGAFDVRQSGYWSVLAGTAGHTYGNHNIWQMWQPGRDPITAARIPWFAAIHQPGAAQMGFMRKLFESRPFLEMVPDQEILAKVFGEDKNMIRTARGKNGSLQLFIPLTEIPYISIWENFQAMKLQDSGTIRGEGTSLLIEAFKNTKKVKAFVPPSSGQMTDWVLVLDDKSKNYPDPATVKLN